MPLYPLKFEPILQPRIWGGGNLARLGRKLPPRGRIGESWELCDRGVAQSVVANGPLTGEKLNEIWHEMGLGRFPLLIKWLDVVEPLSVQVHPDKRAARRVGGEPKTEAWYIVATARDTKIWAGLCRGVTRRDFARAIADGSAEKLLRSFLPRVGEVVLIPAGCIHSARGVVALEVQQNSDTTFRLYDWGRGRELQVKEALACVNPRLQAKRGKSVRCPFFSMRVVTFAKTWKLPRGLSAVCVAKGSGKVCWRDGEENYRAGDCWFLPKGIAVRLHSRRETTVAIVEAASRRFVI